MYVNFFFLHASGKFRVFIETGGKAMQDFEKENYSEYCG